VRLIAIIGLIAIRPLLARLLLRVLASARAHRARGAWPRRVHMYM
jgi:hypothetical protein